MPRSGLHAAVLALGLAACPSVAVPQAVAPATGTAVAPQAYRPGLGDLMTMTVQPRHVKLGLSGKAANWAYAAYELHELEEAFERVGRVWPQWRQFPVTDMVAAIMKDPMAQMAAAIEAADAERYMAAYGQLTDACSSCHASTGRGMIVIKVPDALDYPDQDFRAQRP